MMRKEYRVTSQPVSILLDKGVVRRIYEARVRRAQKKAPNSEQLESLEVFARLLSPSYQLFISESTANVLQLRRPQLARFILDKTSVLQKGRYQRRWARRLRSFVFTREDAVMVAYGSFGVGSVDRQLGVDYFITTDTALVTNFHTRFSEIQARFTPMVMQLPEPYRNVSLPQILTPATVLAHW